MGTITDRQLSAKVDKPVWLIERAPKGHGRFVARLRQSGESLFYYRYADTDGKRQFLPMGAYDPRGVKGLTLKDARQRAGELSKLYLAGNINLREYLQDENILADAHRQAEIARQETDRAQAEAETARLASRITVSGLFSQWLKIDLIHHKDKGAEVIRLFNRDVLPVVGHLYIEEVRTAHISQVLDPILLRGANRMAKLTLTRLRQMFRFAYDREMIEHEPTARLRKAKIGGKEVERNRVLSHQEIALLAKQIPEAGLMASSGAAIWIALATCCRIGELLSAEWQHVDLKSRIWHIQAQNSKNGKAHTVFLSDFAVSQFEIIKIISGGTRWCYPNSHETGQVSSKTMTKQVSDRQVPAGGVPLSKRTKQQDALTLPGGRWTLHDLRRTGATMMVEMGVMPEVAERCLNHTEQNKVKRTYQHYSYAREMQEAWSLLGEKIDRLTRPHANVIEFRVQSS